MALTRRRTLLTGAALGGAAWLTACSEDPAPQRAESSSSADRLRQGAARDSTALLARYDAALAAHPTLAPALRPLRAEVARHAEAFGAGKSRTGVSHPPAAPDAPTARKQLAQAERDLADRRTRALPGAPPELARLLASVAAAGAAHAYLLAKP
ncbi:hypothetical protein [Streptomyces gilvosporeus]|uniref:Lipoprotein n=1 Tax=Streptomyces gilvosporeus TaxID=553510 RepID=A0A1V0TXN2_9ACTN|nr:hypothetical protein [Streptomyces gilvosporeus]ARF57706.1 hypothetical protein B1H19_29085 [Streptomyces gilvosporeus]